MMQKLWDTLKLISPHMHHPYPSVTVYYYKCDAVKHKVFVLIKCLILKVLWTESVSLTVYV